MPTACFHSDLSVTFPTHGSYQRGHARARKGGTRQGSLLPLASVLYSTLHVVKLLLFDLLFGNLIQRGLLFADCVHDKSMKSNPKTALLYIVAGNGDDQGIIDTSCIKK